jgi:hypothetical protein
MSDTKTDAKFFAQQKYLNDKYGKMTLTGLMMRSEELQQQLEDMKCCANCLHLEDDFPCKRGKHHMKDNSRCKDKWKSDGLTREEREK